MALDDYNGTRTLLRRLASSPLVRQSIPNAAATCGQYFDFRRRPSEPMTTFLVRESLNYAEFVEALVRLAEEKQGIRPEDQDFGLPDEWSDWADDDSQEWQWRRWQQDEGLGHAEAEPQEFDRDAEEADAEEATRRNPQAESGSPGGAYQRVPDATPSRRSQAVQPSQTADPINEMSFADSFVLGVLRGYRLLQSAGLSADERRDIISATRGSLEFETVAKALATMWDEQLLGRGHGLSSHLAMNFHESVPEESDESWWSPWHEAQASYHDSGWSSWWDWDDSLQAEQVTETVESEAPAADDPAIKEAQQAERLAQALAAEANRTWSEAQRATAALRRDRGFGAPPAGGGRKGDSKGPCFICGAYGHLSRDCPDRHAPKGYGKGKSRSSYVLEYPEEGYDDFYTSGKGKGKGKKGKLQWLEMQAWMKGKGTSQRFKGKGFPSSVNAYESEVFFGGLELQSSPLELQQTGSSPESVDHSFGLLDSGATASAGPLAAVESLVSSVLSKDSQAKIEIQKGD